ncbi:MAG TPA: glycosyltransferase family 2 protein [Candidatus Brocadiia bacterium]|nr:glycosyltransferase family 2 protein [Candidatus Brocadiia bacterium]
MKPRLRFNNIGRIAFWTALLAPPGIALYSLGSGIVILGWLAPELWGPWAETVAGISALSLDIARVLLGVAFFGFVIDLVVLRNIFITRPPLAVRPAEGRGIVAVGMTAYNDEDAIGDAVKDFLSFPAVKDVIVIDNNCTDRTAKAAREAGAIVVEETRQGYGFACMRAMEEAAARADIIVLVEGDGTFSARDLAKMLAYLENVDMVLGTRTTRELSAPDSQLDWMMNPGNQVVAKLIQLRCWGTRLTDVGCTYRAIRREAYEKLKPRLSVGGMHFSPHMIIEALLLPIRTIEVPVTFRKRVGQSKGVGNRRLRGMWVALQMLWLIMKS